MTGITMYVVTIDGRKHTLRNWQEVTHLCAKSFVSDPEKTVEIRHVAQSQPTARRPALESAGE